MVDTLAQSEDKQEGVPHKAWYKRVSLTTWILVALVIGVLAGLALQGPMQADPEGTKKLIETWIKPIGTIFLNLIKMIVVPLVVFSIMTGIISLKDIKKVGLIGGKTVLFYMVTTAFAVVIGLVFANVLSVGAGYTLSGSESLEYEAKEAPAFVDTIVNIFPSNFFQPMADATMLQVIVIALLFGFGIIAAGKKAEPVTRFVEGMNEVCVKVMHGIICFAPFGVFGLITPVIATNGPDVLMPLLWLIVVAYLAMTAHLVFVYSGMVKIFAKLNPVRFFRGIAPAFLFAFSSASSVGTLPMNMQCTEKMGASKEMTGFVLPLGATINMDGTAIYQGVCAVFIAQVFGYDLSISEQLIIVLTTVLASIGTAGVPGSGMIMLTMVLTSVGLPIEGVALVAGVDRILDMMRTALNITGDSACCLCLDGMDKRKKARKEAKAA